MSRNALVAAAAVLAGLGWISVARAERPDGPPQGPGFGPGFGPHLAERLGLSEDQKARIDALRERERAAHRPLIEAARQTHEAFRSALESAEPDPTAVGQAAIANHAAEKKLRAAREASFEAMKAILTPEQRETLEQARGEGFGPRRGPGRPGRPPGR